MPTATAIGALLGFTGVAATIVGAVVIVGGYVIMQKAQMRAQERAARGADRGLMLNKQSNNDPVPVVIGRRRVGGTRVFVDTTNGSGDVDGTEYLNIIIAMCEGAMGGIEQVYFSDTVVWDVNSGGTTTDLGNGAYRLNNFISDYADTLNGADSTIVYHDGRTTQNVDADLQASIGARWTGAHRLRGVAYLALKLKANAEAFQGGVPVFTAVLAGKYIKDVSGLTDGGSGFSLINGVDQNAIDVLYDYLTNLHYGKGLDHVWNGSSYDYVAGTNIDLESFKSARAYASTRYLMNGFLDTENDLFMNTEEILKSCNAMLIWLNGKYHVRIRKQEEPSVFSFTDDNLLSEIEIATPGKEGRVNKIVANYSDPATNYNENKLIVENLSFLTADSGTTLEQRMDFLLYTDPTVIETLCNFYINYSRNQTIATFTAAHTALTVEPGDIIDITHDLIGYTNKKFRCLEIALNEDNSITITAQEYIDNIQI